MKTIRIVTIAVLMAASAWVLHVPLAGQPVNTPFNKNREEQSTMANERSENSATAPCGACRGRTPIFAIGAGGAGGGSVLYRGPKRRSQYICFLRDLQVASGTGFPSAAGLH